MCILLCVDKSELFILSYRGVFCAICAVSLHLWDSTFLFGDVTGPVHQSGWNHVLEEDLSTVWRWAMISYTVTFQYPCIAAFHFTCIFPPTGLGYGSQVVVLYTGVYYIIILAWAFLYLFSSFSSELPWASCKNYWNTGIPYRTVWIIIILSYVI